MAQLISSGPNPSRLVPTRPVRSGPISSNSDPSLSVPTHPVWSRLVPTGPVYFRPIPSNKDGPRSGLRPAEVRPKKAEIQPRTGRGPAQEWPRSGPEPADIWPMNGRAPIQDGPRFGPWPAEVRLKISRGPTQDRSRSHPRPFEARFEIGRGHGRSTVDDRSVFFEWDVLNRGFHQNRCSDQLSCLDGAAR